MIAVGCTPFLALDPGLDVHRVHQALHQLVICEPFLTSQLRCDAPVAIRGPVGGHILDRLLELGLVRLTSLG